MKVQLKKGSTSNILQIFIADSSSTTGAGLTGLANNTSGLTAYYHRDTDTTATAISLASMTVGTFTSSGFKEIDATNMPGWYQFCPPNAAFASGASSCAFHLKGATNMAPLPIEVELVAYDPQDTVRLGLTALPNAAAEAAGGLYTRGSGAGQINQPANGQIDANTVKVGGTTQTARDLGASVLISSGTGTGQLDVTSGVIKANLAQILGTALTETAGQIAAAFKQFFDVASPTGTMKAITNVVTATNLTTNNDKTGYGLSTAAVQAIWDALTSALTTASSIGKLLVDNINATISSRLASASYTAPDNTSITAIKAKTDNLPASPAAVGDIPTAVQVRQEMDSNSTKLANLDAAISTRATPANVLTQVNSALDAASTELTAVPATTGSLRQFIQFLHAYFRNKKTQTSSTETLYKEDASTTLGTSTLSDNGTTASKGEMN